MKIECHCGALIVDHGDALPHKAHLVPGQDRLPLLGATDAQAVEPAPPWQV